jgi:hypothetical protein
MADDTKVREMIKTVADINYKEQNDSLDLKFGSDGDRGEELIDAFMIYFARREISEIEAQLGNVEQLRCRLQHLHAEIKEIQDSH